MQEIAQNVAVATGRADCDGNHRKLLELCERLFSSETETELLGELVQKLVHSWGADIAWIGRPDADGRLSLDEYAGPEAADYMRQARIAVIGEAVPPGPAARCWKSRQTIMINDWNDEPVMQPWRELGFGWRCSVSVPLLGRRGMAVILSLYSRQPGYFAPMLDVLTALGRLLGMSLEQIQNRQVRRAYENLLDAMTLVQQETSEGADEEQIVRAFTSRFFSVGFFSLIDVLRAESDGGHRIVAVCSNRPDLSDSFCGHILRPSAGTPVPFFLRAFNSNTAVCSNDYPDDVHLQTFEYGEWRTLATELKLRQFAAIPVRVDKQVWGTLCLGANRGRVDFLSMVELFTRLGDVLGVKIEKRRHEIRLEDSLKRLRLTEKVFASTQEGILITDANERIIYANDALTRITGYTAAELTGKTPRMFKSGSHDRYFYQRLWSSVHHTGRWQGEIWNRRKNGELIPVIISISALADEAGQISHYVGVSTDITDLKAKEAHLRQLAASDFLTGLPNRYALEQHLQTALPRAARHKRGLALAILDLDLFKPVNDAHGHAAGDQILRELAVRLKASLRDADFLARLGGDEFVMVLEEILEKKDLDQVLNRIREAVDKPFVIDQANVQIKASIGVALHAAGAPQKNDLLRDADMALYSVKQDRGRSGSFYAVYDTCVDTPAIGGRSGDDFFPRLIQTGLEVHYQPVLSVPAGEIREVEALARLRSGSELYFPGQFLSRLSPLDIRRLSLAVLEESLRQLHAWDAAGRPVRIAVNFEALDLLDTEMLRDVARIIDHSGIPTQRITLEILEGGEILSHRGAKQAMQRFKDLGVHIAMDDLGSAYASLLRVRELPVDVIKLDHTFCVGLQRRPKDLQFLMSVLDLARGLTVDCVIEGVENPDVFAAVRTLGARFVQGYAIAPPAPAAQMLQLLKTSPLKLDPPEGSLAAYAGHLIWYRSVVEILLRTPGIFSPLAAGDISTCPLTRQLARFPELDALHRELHRQIAEIAAGAVPVRDGLRHLRDISRSLRDGIEQFLSAPPESAPGTSYGPCVTADQNNAAQNQ